MDSDLDLEFVQFGYFILVFSQVHKETINSQTAFVIICERFPLEITFVRFVRFLKCICTGQDQQGVVDPSLHDQFACGFDLLVLFLADHLIQCACDPEIDILFFFYLTADFAQFPVEQLDLLRKVFFGCFTLRMEFFQIGKDIPLFRFEPLISGILLQREHVLAEHQRDLVFADLLADDAVFHHQGNFVKSAFQIFQLEEEMQLHFRRLGIAVRIMLQDFAEPRFQFFQRFLFGIVGDIFHAEIDPGLSIVIRTEIQCGLYLLRNGWRRCGVAQGNEHVAAGDLRDQPDAGIKFVVLIQIADQVAEPDEVGFRFRRSGHMDLQYTGTVTVDFFFFRDFDRFGKALDFLGKELTKFSVIFIGNTFLFFQKRIKLFLVKFQIFIRVTLDITLLVLTPFVIFLVFGCFAKDKDVFRREMSPRDHDFVFGVPSDAVPEQPDKKFAFFDMEIVFELLSQRVVKGIQIFPFDQMEMNELLLIHLIELPDQIADPGAVRLQLIRRCQKYPYLLHFSQSPVADIV